MLQSHLLSENVHIDADSQLLILNSAANPFVQQAAQQLTTGTITLAEDNIATATKALLQTPAYQNVQHVTFHDYILHYPAGTMDIALIDLLYQPGNSWIRYGLQVAQHALKQGGRLYVTGAKDRGILSIAKRLQEQFGNIDTLAISKGHRVICSRSTSPLPLDHIQTPTLFASSKLDEGTQLLLEALEVKDTDVALDIGCGAGFIGLHLARLAPKGYVTMVDASLAAVAATQHAIEQSGLTNVRVFPSDGVQAVLKERFDLIATNPPFHQGGIQTLEIAERFIREARQVMHPYGRFYLVANRFLKYEPVLQTHFKKVKEVKSNTRYKVVVCT